MTRAGRKSPRPGTPDDEPKQAGHHSGHTAESAWRAWDGWDAIPDVDLPANGAPVLVVSAHPDDDVLAVGGLLLRLRTRGCVVSFVCATDGEASHPGSPTLSPAGLALHRGDELRRAWARLGHAASPQTLLHLQDGRLRDARAELATRLAPHLDGVALALAPWSGDGHPDHEACGRAALAAAQRAAGTLTVCEYPVWAWHWAAPGGVSLPLPRARAVRLQPDERLAKAAAINCFRSQLEPLSDDPADAAVLPHPVLAHFTRGVEVVFE